MRTVERAVIEMLTSEPLGWRYERGETVTQRYRSNEAEVLLEPILKQKLQELNPETVVSEGRADMVVSRLKGIRENTEWLAWLRGDMTMKFSVEEPYVNVNLIDFDEIGNNDFLVTNQLPIEGLDKTRYPDMLLYVNGVPLVDIEAKTASRGTLDWREGAEQTGFYQRESIPQLFYSNAFGVGVDELNFRYGVPGMSLKRWHPWRTASPHTVPERDKVKTAVYGLFDRSNFLDMLRNFIVFEQEEGELEKKVARYQQFGIANELLARAKAREEDPEVRRGLAWQTQGSGKSMAMLCAARKLWYDPEMAQPTILVVVDRQQLLGQMTAQFFNTNTENAVEAHSIRDLQRKLEDDYRGIIVTTVQRFDNLTQIFYRDNIVVMADEAHRSQEGDLGTYMRHALPNASMFGFTGTPIERDDRNTPRNWGKRKPDGSYERYMDPPYRIKDALEDEAIVPIHYQLRLSDWRVHREDLDVMFERVFADHSDAEKAALKQQGSRLSVILKHPERVSQIAQDIARDFKRQVRPNGFKAMLVCHDKETCDLYKTQLDTLLGEDASFVVISEDEKRDPDNVKRHYLGDDQRKRAPDAFKDPVPSDPI